jgi:hypothetical protein
MKSRGKLDVCMKKGIGVVVLYWRRPDSHMPQLPGPSCLFIVIANFFASTLSCNLMAYSARRQRIARQDSCWLPASSSLFILCIQRHLSLVLTLSLQGCSNASSSPGRGTNTVPIIGAPCIPLAYIASLGTLLYIYFLGVRSRVRPTYYFVNSFGLS